MITTIDLTPAQLEQAADYLSTCPPKDPRYEACFKMVGKCLHEAIRKKAHSAQQTPGNTDVPVGPTPYSDSR